MPLVPSPTTTTRLSFTSSNGSPELEAREAHERQKDGDDPEADDDLGLRPALLLVVVVNRRHQEDALAGELEAHDLRHDAESLEEEDAAEDDREQLVLEEHGASAEPATERERTDVSHEDLRGVRVVPEEADAGAEQRSAEDGELTGARDLRDVEVARDDEALRDVGDTEGRAAEVRPNQVGARVEDDRSDRQTVETIGEVDRVRRRNDAEDREGDVDATGSVIGC